MTNPTANSLYSYEVMGEISIPLTAYDDGNHEIDVTFALDRIFYPDKINTTKDIDKCAPELIPGVSAFSIRLMNGGRPVGGFVAIITELKQYEIRLDSSLREYWVALKFSFDKVATDYRSADVPDVPVVVKDILVHDGFIALVFAGDPDEIIRNMHTHRIFRHGNNVYHAYAANRMAQQVAADRDRMVICTVLYASTSEIPDEKGKELFGAMVSYYMDTTYRASEYK